MNWHTLYTSDGARRLLSREFINFGAATTVVSLASCATNARRRFLDPSQNAFPIAKRIAYLRGLAWPSAYSVCSFFSLRLICAAEFLLES